MEEAYDWFENLRAGAGDEFSNAVEQTFTSIAAQPRMHAKIKAGVRRAPVPGYPYYRVIYRERSGDVEVLSVFHTSRDPAVWQGRV